jgi:glycosyltransferase involved in cell wall biosynthesis
MTQIDVSVLFISFNRSDLLRVALRSLKKHSRALGSCEFVVSDDGSSGDHLANIAALDFDTHVWAKRNSGLGANVNRGMRACKGKLILQIQDDWEFVGDASALRRCIDILQADRRVGILQLTPVSSDLPVEQRSVASSSYRIFRNDGLPWSRSCRVRPYSDCPHLKLREFIEDLGPYLEAVPMGICENDYKARVARQRKWRVAQFDGGPIFRHLGAESSFNSAGQTHPAIAAIRRVPLIGTRAERLLRGTVALFDHMCARFWSRLFS